VNTNERVFTGDPMHDELLAERLAEETCIDSLEVRILHALELGESMRSAHVRRLRRELREAMARRGVCAGLERARARRVERP
jgi:hypothetical protein